MFEFFRERRCLSRLQRERHKTDQDWAQRIEKLRKSGENYVVIMKERTLVRESYDEEIAQVIFNRLVRQATDLIIPIPDLDDDTMWIETPASGSRRLSAKAIHELRAAIRKERRERVEFWTFRISTATGLIGTLIGLVTVLKR